MTAYLAGVLVASAVAGFAVGRWWAVLLPVVALAVLYAGLGAEWWGNGLGDAWELALAASLLAGLAGTAAGVATRRSSLLSPRE